MLYVIIYLLIGGLTAWLMDKVEVIQDLIDMVLQTGNASEKDVEMIYWVLLITYTVAWPVVYLSGVFTLIYEHFHKTEDPEA